MKQQLVRAGILLSAALNVATIAGVIYGAYFAKASASTTPDLAPAFKQLNMTPEQKTSLDSANAAALKRITAARDRMRAKWSEGVRLLSARELDMAAIRAKQNEITEAQRAYQDIFFQVWVERASLFSPEQRRMLFDTVDRQIKSGVFFNWRLPERNQNEGKR